ncbi:MAG: hypothetical protein WED10_14420 [Brumimicrobium sp.]
MKSFSNFILVVSSVVFVVFTFSCKGDEEKTETPTLVFDYFDKNTAVERLFNWNIDAVYVTLPECFEENIYQRFSITSEHDYSCNSKNAFFSIDHFSKEDISYYKKYFQEEKSIDDYSDEEVILDYIKSTRVSNIYGSSSSILSSKETFQQKDIYLIAVTGRANDYENSLYYQFGAIRLKDKIYLLQFIVNENDINFYHQDIMKIFKSIRHA